MTVISDCMCRGSYCDCGSAVLQDGKRRRIPALMMDGAISGEKHVVFDAASSDTDRAYAEMKVRDASGWQGGHAASHPVADAIHDRARDVFGDVYATMRADGHDDGSARHEASYQEMKERDRSAWQAQG